LDVSSVELLRGATCTRLALDLDNVNRRTLVGMEDGGQIREHNHVDSVLLRRRNSFHFVSRPRIADGI